MINLKGTHSAVMREPLKAALGFKGRYINELWQIITQLEDQSGIQGYGLAIQSILWSDSRCFEHFGEDDGNHIMYKITKYALSLAAEQSYDTPFELLEDILPKAYAYGKEITGFSTLKQTFVLNALVSIDHAAWHVYSQLMGTQSLSELLPADIKPYLSERHEAVAAVPTIAYGMPEQDILALLESGYFILKIKTGADPDQDGDMEKMLKWDQERLRQIHNLSNSFQTPHTSNGKIAYYIDANGRYDAKERLVRFLEYADEIGALEQIILIEEPFMEEVKVDISDLPVIIAGDESVHNEQDALERIELGYQAFALKPIAKTMSKSLNIAKLALERNISCFCADLTVNPMMVDWNKSLSALLPPIKGIKMGLIESNGAQNYANWQQMQTYHPQYGAPWTKMDNGVFELNKEFYACSGGALSSSKKYSSLF